MKVLWAVAIVSLSHLGTGTAYADSDGYYCVGPRYLAYQFGYAAPPVRPHRIFVIRLDGLTKIQPPVIFEIPQFQVHGMLCHDRSIQLAAYDAIYTIDLDATTRPVRYASTPWPQRGQVPPEFVGQSRNLGSSNAAVGTLKPVRIALLEAFAAGGPYLLDMNATATSAQRCPPILTTTRLIRTDRNGREVEGFQIFRGPGIRACGE